MYLDSINDVAETRRRVRGHLVGGSADADMIADCLLVLTELAVNAFEHGHAPHVRTEIAVDGAGVTVTLRHTDTGTAPDPAAAQMPPVTVLRGRGLALACAMSTSLTRHLDGPITVSVATLVPSSPVGDPSRS